MEIINYWADLCEEKIFGNNWVNFVQTKQFEVAYQTWVSNINSSQTHTHSQTE
jgi:hypothetical protein